MEETGHGRVLTEDFINHRIKMSLPKMDPVQESDDEAEEAVANVSKSPELETTTEQGVGSPKA